MAVTRPRAHNNPLATSFRVGLFVQTLMVTAAYLVPSAGGVRLFPFVGTGIGLVIGVLASRTITHLPVGVVGATGGLAAGVSAALASLIATGLDLVPLTNIWIAGGLAAAAGTVSSLLTRALRPRT